MQYQKLTPMLLNEVQRLNKQNLNQAVKLQAEQAKNQAQEKLIQEQARQISALKTHDKAMAGLQQQVSALQAQMAEFNTLSARLAKMEAQQMVGWDK